MNTSLQSWYETLHQNLTTQGETARAHLLRESYHKTLSYVIHLSSIGTDMPLSGQILQCLRLYEQYCWQ